MKYQNMSSIFVISAALMAGATATTAIADITAEDVWQGWADYYTSMGQTLTVGTKTMQADTLIISEAVLTAAMSDGTFNATVAEIRLRELGDGRIEVTMSDTIPLRILGRPATGEDVDLNMTISHSGLSAIVSGSATDTLYTYASDKISVDLVGIKVDDQAVEMTANVVVGGGEGTYRMATEDSRRISSDFSANSLDFSVSAKDPAKGGSVVAAGGLTGLTGMSSAIIPVGFDVSDMNAVLQNGMEASGSFAYDTGGYSMDIDAEQQSVLIETSSEGGALNFALSKAGMSYGGESKANQVEINASNFPLPIDLSLASSAFSISVPVSKSETEQPFAALLKLVDLKVSDGLWNMIDPGVQLPRGPATVILDLTGAARLFLDIMDPANAQQLNQQPPGELTALNLNELKLSAAGADLTGKGAVTFDNQGFVPQPLGSVDLQLVGGNGLIDKLVATGLVPEDQAMGARMMMGLFAVVSGEDTLTSKIEFKEGGSIFANGQRIK